MFGLFAGSGKIAESSIQLSSELPVSVRNDITHKFSKEPSRRGCVLMLEEVARVN